jgi:hypothetical protein
MLWSYWGERAWTRLSLEERVVFGIIAVNACERRYRVFGTRVNGICITFDLLVPAFFFFLDFLVGS